MHYRPVIVGEHGPEFITNKEGYVIMTTPIPVAPSPLQLLQEEPALVANFLAAAAILISAFWVQVSQPQEAAITTIATSVAGLLVAFLAHKATVALLVTFVTTGLTAAAAFGLKIPPETLGFIATALTSILSVILRGHLTPVVTLRRQAAAQRAADRLN